MALEEKLTAKEILRESGVHPDPYYFSGRGADLSDLNSEHLEKIYCSIKEIYGLRASKNFVKMVEEIPVLSATDFIISFYALEGNEWKYEKKKVKSDATGGISVRKNAGGNYDRMHGELSILSALTRGGRNETRSIREPFLIKYSTNYRSRFDSFVS